MPIIIPSCFICKQRALLNKGSLLNICAPFIVFLHRGKSGISAIFSLRGKGNCFYSRGI